MRKTKYTVSVAVYRRNGVGLELTVDIKSAMKQKELVKSITTLIKQCWGAHE